MALGATDGLIFNLDPSVIDSLESENLEAQYKQVLGENTELVNFNWNEESGLTKSSFNFDGVDDYITVEYKNEEEKQTLANNGFTFEFYGILNDGTSYNDQKEIITYNYKGLFCYWNGDEMAMPGFRFGNRDNGQTITWNAGSGKYLSDFSESANVPWNIRYPKINDYRYGQEGYFTITLDCSNSYTKEEEEYYPQTLYFNGEKLYEGGYNKKSWQYFVDNDLKNTKYFCIRKMLFE